MTRIRLAAVLIGVLALTAATPAQEVFQFVVAARDTAGKPVTDLKAADVVMKENGVANETLKVEPFKLPVKLTIAVDNGIDSRKALSHYRSGLEGFIKALPPDMEASLIVTAPQPRTVVKMTTDKVQLLKGVSSFAPEDAAPRFADMLVEYAKRLEEDYNKTKKLDSLPVLVLVSTTAADQTSYQAQEIDKRLQFLVARKVRLSAVVLNTGTAGEQSQIAVPMAKNTHGRYEALADSTRLATLLPEMGAEIATLHQQRSNQLLVTVARKSKGPIQNVAIEMTREGVAASVSPDGFPQN